MVCHAFPVRCTGRSLLSDSFVLVKCQLEGNVCAVLVLDHSRISLDALRVRASTLEPAKQTHLMNCKSHIAAIHKRKHTNIYLRNISPAKSSPAYQVHEHTATQISPNPEMEKVHPIQAKQMQIHVGEQIAKRAQGIGAMKWRHAAESEISVMGLSRDLVAPQRTHT